MTLQNNDLCIDIRDDWLSVQTRVFKRLGDEVGTVPLLRTADLKPTDVYAEDDVKFLQPSAYNNHFRRIHPNLVGVVYAIKDAASNHLRAKGPTEVDALISYIGGIPSFRKLGKTFIVFCIKSGLTDEVFIAERAGRAKNKKTVVKLSARQVAFENQRTFAGSLASELLALSKRIGLLIGHSSTVGTYRENLLQSLLRKHLPERYHVATGFIYNCPKQIDVLIYDRNDYAPIFREGDLVVVLRESVRAVIEVKTTLDAKTLKDGLLMIEAVSPHDDGHPPFFKGIFAFKNKLSSSTLSEKIVNFYTALPDFFEHGDLLATDAEADTKSETALPSGDSDDDEVDDADGFHDINWPYQHLTSLCVLEETYLQVALQRKGGKNGPFVPTLYSVRSETEMPIQATLFLDSLLSYLRVETLKPALHSQMTRLLGTDVRKQKIGELASEDWGAYAAQSAGLPDGEQSVREMEEQIEAIGKWLQGGDNFK